MARTSPLSGPSVAIMIEPRSGIARMNFGEICLQTLATNVTRLPWRSNTDRLLFTPRTVVTLPRCISPSVAQPGHVVVVRTCLLLVVERTCRSSRPTSDLTQSGHAHELDPGQCYAASVG